MYRFKFADIGEGIHEGKVGEILVKKGDSVTDGTDIIVVETDKVTTPISSPVNGIISEVLISVGDTIHVGQDLFVIDTNESSSSTPSQPQEQAPAIAQKTSEEPKQEEAASVVGEVKVSNNVLPMFGNQGISSSKITTSNANVTASPVARMLAKENNININTINGTGPLNRVLKDDVLNAINSNSQSNNLHSQVATNIVNNSQPISQPAQVVEQKKVEIKPDVLNPNDKVVETTSMRKAIAKAMTDSWANVAYTNLAAEIDVTDIWDQRNKFKDAVLKQENVKLTLLPFIVKAIAKSLEEYPIFNAYTNNQNNGIILKGDINIGIAIDTPDGLIVPNVKSANKLSILEIAKEISTLASNARSKKIKMSDLSNGTFSITNYGSLGVDFGVPVIKFPEVAIAGIGTLKDKIVKKNNEFVERKTMYLTVAADHRWIDGGDIARFIAKIKQYLEDYNLLFN